MDPKLGLDCRIVTVDFVVYTIATLLSMFTLGINSGVHGSD